MTGSRLYENEDEGENLGFSLPENVKEMTDQELAVWYNDNMIYPDKVRLNIYYYRHYSLTCGRACSCSAIGKQACHCSRVLAAFAKDIEMIFATVVGRKVKFAGEEV